MKQNDKNKRLICQALGWKEGDYHIFQFEAGYEYLLVKIKIYERIQAIAKTHTWWSWWQQQWDTTDQRFINELQLEGTMVASFGPGIKQDLFDLYKLEHSPAEMKVYPSRVVRQLIDHENQGLLKFKDIN